jgi:hypothetical protein
MKSEKNKVIQNLEKFLTLAGYTDDPRIIPQIKNRYFFHKLRKKMYSGGFIETVEGIGEKYDKMKNNYDLLLMGFWSVYPVLFAALSSDQVRSKGFVNIIKKYNSDIFQFRPNTAKCVLRVTIWPKIEVRSHPFGYLAIIFNDFTDYSNSFNSIQKEWANLAPFEKYAILPLFFILIKEKTVLMPFSKTSFTKYPPSLKELKNGIFF